MQEIILNQETLRLVLRKVRGCKDYQDEEQLLVRGDGNLINGGVDQKFLGKSMEFLRAAGKGEGGGRRKGS